MMIIIIIIEILLNGHETGYNQIQRRVTHAETAFSDSGRPPP